MGESSVLGVDNWKFASSSNDVKTLVLFGRTGNGKSATGNSILGNKVFRSRARSSSDIDSCEMKKTVMYDGQIVKVIDTPGLFELSAKSEFVAKEIVKCIDLAKDGIHVIIVVLSVRSRFSVEDENALCILQTLFGSKIFDYMIVVFTCGDVLEDNDETLDDYLGLECPKSLKAILSLCENRCVLFDNKTKDEKKQFDQVQQLLSFVNMVVSKNDGRPFTNELFEKLKEGLTKLREPILRDFSNEAILELKNRVEQEYNYLLNQITELVESKLENAATKLELQLAQEKFARQEAEIEKLKLFFETYEELRNRAENSGCVIQ